MNCGTILLVETVYLKYLAVLYCVYIYIYIYLDTNFSDTYLQFHKQETKHLAQRSSSTGKQMN